MRRNNCNCDTYNSGQCVCNMCQKVNEHNASIDQCECCICGFKGNPDKQVKHTCKRLRKA
jgi:hypothetical protein